MRNERKAPKIRFEGFVAEVRREEIAKLQNIKNACLNKMFV